MAASEMWELIFLLCQALQVELHSVYNEELMNDGKVKHKMKWSWNKPRPDFVAQLRNSKLID